MRSKRAATRRDERMQCRDTFCRRRERRVVGIVLWSDSQGRHMNSQLISGTRLYSECDVWQVRFDSQQIAVAQLIQLVTKVSLQAIGGFVLGSEMSKVVKLLLKVP